MSIEQIVELILATYALINIIVGLTPTTKDDNILKKIISILSFLTHKNQPGTFKLPGTKV